MGAARVKVTKRSRRQVASVGRSVFYDLFPADKAAVMEIRALLLFGLERWLEKSGMTKAKAAGVLGITPARLADLKKGKINRMSMDSLVRWAARAELKPKLYLRGRAAA